MPGSSSTAPPSTLIASPVAAPPSHPHWLGVSFAGSHDELRALVAEEEDGVETLFDKLMLVVAVGSKVNPSLVASLSSPASSHHFATVKQSDALAI